MRKLSIFFLLIFVFSACKKDSETTSTLEITMANIAGNYKITAATGTVVGITTDVYNNASIFNPCLKDDLYTFAANGNYSVNDNATVCSPSTTTTTGTYTVNTAAKTITINGQTGTIVSLTSTAAVVTQSNFRGTGVDVTLTYTKQ